MPENKNDIDLGTWTLHSAAHENRVDIARALIDRGADIDARDETGGTPLHIAAGANFMEFAKFLIEHGADIEAKDDDGWTPLARTGENYVGTNLPEVALLLIEYGANTKGVVDLGNVMDITIDQLRSMDDQEDA